MNKQKIGVKDSNEKEMTALFPVIYLMQQRLKN